MPIYVLAFLLILCSSLANAASLSTYRIYLDKQTREQSFVVFNKNNLEESCELYLRHYVHDLYGNMTEVKGENVPDFSVKPHLRFTPKNFILGANSSQTVKFKMKRKRGAKGEYTSYLAIKCRPKRIAKSSGVNVTPQIVMNVPIVIRTSELSVDLTAQNVKLGQSMLTGELVRKGERSVYGDLIVFDKKTNEVLAQRRNISIYSSQQFHKFKMQLPLSAVGSRDLMIQFVESGVALFSKPIVN